MVRSPIVAGCAVLAATAWAAPVSPSVFGRVFQAHRQALVRVESAHGLATGFVVGARGEILLGSRQRPADGAALKVTTVDGAVYEAFVVAHEPALRLTLAQIAVLPALPLQAVQIGAQTRLRRNQWVVVMSHSEAGAAEPFAGTVDAAAATNAAKARGHARFKIAKVAAPGRLGSPVLDTSGRLAGVVVRPGKRRTEVVAVSDVLAFLKAVWR